MEDDQLNIEDEYKKLAAENSGHHDNNNKRMNSERKLTCGILKRRKVRKKSQFVKGEKIINNSGIKWDNKTIDEQKDYRKNHPLDKEKLKSSISKYSTSVSDKDDIYMKGLNKVNQMKETDELISRIFNSLNESNTNKKCLKRNRSCLSLKCKKAFSLKDLYNFTEVEKIFDDNLEEEQKLTLQNTLYNKLSKKVKI